MSYKQLTLERRYEIYGLLHTNLSKSEISRRVGIHKSTLYRELKRNRGFRGYRPRQAGQKAARRRQQACKHIRFTDHVKERVEHYLREDWSPEQISGYLAMQEKIHISHETIYQHVWADKYAGGSLFRHLRWSRRKRRKRYGKRDQRGHIRNRTSIDERPFVVAQKTRVGDWEVDTIIGKRHKGALVTAVERKTKFTCIKQVVDRKADTVTQALIDILSPYKNRVLTITVDNGKEFASHQKIARALAAAVYFAHPYHAWERGLNENTNGLIRQYFPKNADLTTPNTTRVRLGVNAFFS
jgi:IS30 family transposase